jgi:glycosyltransferase involved in cell wall biosynthesis
MSASPPVVSVILPTRNRAHLLPRAIRSVVAQTFTGWELVVVDDGSSDRTLEVVEEFGDPRIVYVRRDSDHGLCQARNAGMAAAARSQYFAFLDDDDEWLPAKLEWQLAVFAAGRPDLAVVGGGRVDRDEDGVETILPRHRGAIFEHLLARRAKGYSGVMVLVRRPSAGEDPVFDPTFKCLEDVDYLLRIARGGSTFDYVPRPVINVYRDHGTPHVWNHEGAIRGYERLLDKYRDDLVDRPRVAGYYHYCVARELAALGRTRESQARLREAAALDPANVRLRLWQAASYLGPIARRACNRLFPVAVSLLLSASEEAAALTLVFAP